MSDILHDLFLLADPDAFSQEEREAVRRYDQVCAALGDKLTAEEEDRLLSAAVAVGTADLERITAVTFCLDGGTHLRLDNIGLAG